MARRRAYRPWWHTRRDARQREGFPFTFMQEQHLVALGVAKQLGVAKKAPQFDPRQFDPRHVSTSFGPISVEVHESEDVIAIDPELLRTWIPPAGATDAYVLAVDDHPPAVVKRSPSGTRIDDLAARALWTLRPPLETGGLLTRHAWCIHCGRHFEDQRNGHHEQILQFCPAHRNTRSKYLPQRRWFRPMRGDRIFCSNPCRSASQARTASRGTVMGQ